MFSIIWCARHRHDQNYNVQGTAPEGLVSTLGGALKTGSLCSLGPDIVKAYRLEHSLCLTRHTGLEDLIR